MHPERAMIFAVLIGVSLIPCHTEANGNILEVVESEFELCDNLVRSDPLDAKESDFSIDDSLSGLSGISGSIITIVDLKTKKISDHAASMDQMQHDKELSYTQADLYDSVTKAKGSLLRYYALLMRERYLDASDKENSGFKYAYEESKKRFCNLVRHTQWPS
jgi:hypothetical protein